MDRGPPAGLLGAANDGRETGQCDRLVGKRFLDHRDHIHGWQRVGMDNADEFACRGLNPRIDLLSPASLAFQDTPTGCARDCDRVVGAAAIDQHYLSRCRIKRAKAFDQFRQRLGFIEHRNEQCNAHSNSGHAARSSAVSISASSGNIAGPICRAARRASVSGKTLAVLHSISSNRNGISSRKPIR